MKDLGINDLDLLNGLLKQLMNVSLQYGRPDDGMLNATLSLVRGLKPTDATECMLASQIAGIHNAVMAQISLLSQTTTIMEQDSAQRTLSNLIRMMDRLVERLVTYRKRAAEQNVTVVAVAPGGQAIVGDVTHPPVSNKSETRPAVPKAISDAKAIPMPMLDNTEPRVRVRLNQ